MPLDNLSESELSSVLVVLASIHDVKMHRMQMFWLVIWLKSSHFRAQPERRMRCTAASLCNGLMLLFGLQAAAPRRCSAKHLR